MIVKQHQLEDLVNKSLLPQFRAEEDNLKRIDKWARWSHDEPHAPRTSTREYKELSGRAQAPWLALVVETVVQGLYVDGYRRANSDEDAPAWSIWQKNGFDSRQLAIHQAAVTYGTSYVTVLPGRMPDNSVVPFMRGVSPKRMMAFYEDPAEDDWPQVAIRVHNAGDIANPQAVKVRLYDDQNVYWFSGENSGEVKHLKTEEHKTGFCPVVRFTNTIDTEGRTNGEVEPYIPIAARIDQTVFDRLVVQRFASWVVRTIAGMAKPDTDESADLEKLRMKVEDILIAEDPDTKFGSLPATPLDGFIKAHEADVGVLAAISQTPSHEMLGQIANLSAEALAAARASLQAKIDKRRQLFGESHEQMLRLAALVAKDKEAASDYEAQVQWRDTSIRSMAQAADALGKLAQMLNVPVEFLWEKVPGWTQQDVERAKSMVQQDGITALLEQINASEELTPSGDQPEG